MADETLVSIGPEGDVRRHTVTVPVSLNSAADLMRKIMLSSIILLLASLTSNYPVWQIIQNIFWIVCKLGFYPPVGNYGPMPDLQYGAVDATNEQNGIGYEAQSGSITVLSTEIVGDAPAELK